MVDAVMWDVKVNCSLVVKTDLFTLLGFSSLSGYLFLVYNYKSIPVSHCDTLQMQTAFKLSRQDLELLYIVTSIEQ